jgi:hypothetical protein
MRTIKTFENFGKNSNIEELEYNPRNMIRCNFISNLIPGNFHENLLRLADVVKESLTEETLNKMFGNMLNHFEYDNTYILNFFITSVVNKDDLLRMFDKVEIQEGSDGEDEWVATLRIKGKIVLLLASPERGNSIRIEGDKYLPIELISDIIRELCTFYNNNF